MDSTTRVVFNPDHPKDAAKAIEKASGYQPGPKPKAQKAKGVEVVSPLCRDLSGRNTVLRALKIAGLPEPVARELGWGTASPSQKEKGPPAQVEKAVPASEPEPKKDSKGPRAGRTPRPSRST